MRSSVSLAVVIQEYNIKMKIGGHPFRDAHKSVIKNVKKYMPRNGYAVKGNISYHVHARLRQQFMIMDILIFMKKF